MLEFNPIPKDQIYFVLRLIDYGLVHTWAVPQVKWHLDVANKEGKIEKDMSDFYKGMVQS